MKAEAVVVGARGAGRVEKEREVEKAMVVVGMGSDRGAGLTLRHQISLSSKC